MGLGVKERSRSEPSLTLLRLSAVAPAARGADVPPDTLPPPTTQIYSRWDGVAAHKDAYARSARGQMLAGDTGRFLASFYERLLQVGVQNLFGEPLLRGED